LSEREDDDVISPRERHALAQWRTPESGEDFGARVLASLEAERAPRGLRHLAVAALALVLVGGFFAARAISSGTSTFGEVHRVPGDGGSSLEASPLGDGVRS
jgi:hypothetical protein